MNIVDFVQIFISDSQKINLILFNRIVLNRLWCFSIQINTRKTMAAWMNTRISKTFWFKILHELLAISFNSQINLSCVMERILYTYTVKCTHTPFGNGKLDKDNFLYTITIQFGFFVCIFSHISSAFRSFCLSRIF